MINNEATQSRLVVVRDDDPQVAEQIREALAEIDPQLVLVPTTTEEEVVSLPPSEKGTPVLFILPSTFRAALPTSAPVIVTSFELSKALVTAWSNRGVFNLVLRPFDPLLLRQHLRLALAGGHPPSDFNVHNMKTNALIEMLKAAPMEAVSEVGFVTRSEREVHLGQVTKFYARAFEWNHRQSVHARVWDQRPHAKVANERSVLLTWFGTPREQMLKIRERFPKKELAGAEWRHPNHETPACLLVLGDPSPPAADLAGSLRRTFPRADVRAYPDLPPPNTPLPANVTAVLVHQSLVERMNKDARLASLPHVILCSKLPSDEEFRFFATQAVDVETLPTERLAFVKKMMTLFPGLEAEEDLHVKTYLWEESLEIGQAVEISDMNEAGLVLRYERPLAVGTIRHFVLWQPVEAGLPTLTARCFATEPDPARKGAFLNHFVFFGMSDHEIKHVRLWMLDKYIAAKQKEP